MGFLGGAQSTRRKWSTRSGMFPPPAVAQGLYEDGHDVVRK